MRCFGGSALLAILCLLLGVQPSASEEPTNVPTFYDLSLLVAADYPVTWPSFPPFQINHYQQVGPRSDYNSDLLVLDGNTGTQLDVPPHSVTPPDSQLPNAGQFGTAYTDRIAAWQFVGEACVVDCRDLVDTTAAGRSPLVTRDRVQSWEKSHRPLGSGDVVLFFSGWSDKYYRPLPEGRRYAADPVEGRTPAWPDPDPDCMAYLASRHVMTAGTDSTSMGPMPDLAEPTHYAGLKHGMIWIESGTGFGALPATGAFYCAMGPKHAGDPYSEARAFAIAGGELPAKLIESAREHRVVDLSVVLSEDLPTHWPGRGVGNHRQPYMTVRFGLNPNTQKPFPMHMLDSNSGTHLVPPAYALPPPGFERTSYSAQTQAWLADFERHFGPPGTSNVTADQVPLDVTCGPARRIDVRHVMGRTTADSWPASPEITAADIQRYEQQQGPLMPNEIILFECGWTDERYRSLPAGAACLADPLAGKCEGWPALGPEAIAYLADKKIRCVGTDSPTLGGVDPRKALNAYWLLGAKGMVGVEFLTNLHSLPMPGYFIFAAPRIKDTHGCPGRAIGLY